MTERFDSTGASSAKRKETWNTLPWSMIKAQVFRLQVRIAKAEREGRKGRVKALQRLLTTSFYGKCLAIKRVSSSPGSKTPGVDGVLWHTSGQKMKAISELRRRGYSSSPAFAGWISIAQNSGVSVKFNWSSTACSTLAIVHFPSHLAQVVL